MRNRARTRGHCGVRERWTLVIESPAQTSDDVEQFTQQKSHQENTLETPLFPSFCSFSTLKKKFDGNMEKSLTTDPTQQRDTPENQPYKATCYAENPALQHSDNQDTTKLSQRKWTSWFTQRSSDPPFLLKYRSSDSFIIGTVALAVFTVSHPHPHHHCCIKISKNKNKNKNLHYQTIRAKN